MKHVNFLTFQRQFLKHGPDVFPAVQRQYGDIAQMFIPFIPRVFYVFRPDDVHAILVENADKVEKPALVTNVLKSSFGDGLFTSGGQKWKRQRKLMQPTFHHAKISKFAERMTVHTTQHLDSWRDGDLKRIDAEMHALTFKIVVDALFTADGSQATAEVADALDDLNAAVVAQGNNLALTFMPDWSPLPIMRRKRRGVAILNRIIGQMVTERRNLGEENSPADLLSALVFSRDPDTGEQMEDQQIHDELLTLFVAGHDTTALTLSWAWVMLSQHPGAEAALHAELASVLGGRTPTLADLPSLAYTAQIVKETLRLYPAAWFTMRQTTDAIALPGTGETIPKGAIIFLFPYAVHRDPRWFNEPASFQPERRGNEFEKSLPKGTYFPFGMGPRVCIGNGFAMMEAQLLLATIAQRYRVELCAPDSVRVSQGATTLGFAKPVEVRLHQHG